MAALVPGSVKSWLNGDFQGLQINLVVSNQQDLHPASCTHHSFALIVESTHKIFWAKNKDNRAKQDLRIDIRWLLDMFPPPTTMQNLISALNKSPSNGAIKATNGTFPFKVLDSRYLLIGFGEVDREENLEIVDKYLSENGPVLGSFYPSPCYKPSQNVVYVTDNCKQKIQCPECRRPLTLRHAVCVVGTALASINGIFQDCFVYIESENPKLNSRNGDGMCYMTTKSMHSITLPCLQ